MEFLAKAKVFMLNALCVVWFGIFLIGCIYIVVKAMQMQKQENEKTQSKANFMR